MNKFEKKIRCTENKPKSIFPTFAVKMLCVLLIVGVLTGCYHGSKLALAAQVSQNPKTTSSSSDSSVTLTLYNGKITLDLSNPTAPKVKYIIYIKYSTVDK